jgi:hypothetical protein
MIPSVLDLVAMASETVVWKLVMVVAAALE